MKLNMFTGLIMMLFTLPLNAQNFTRVVGSTLSNTGLEDYWTGAAWIDVDGDEDLDLFLTNRKPGITPRSNKLYLNEEGSFSAVTDGDLVSIGGFYFGNSWGDYNNDGLVDVFVAGYPGRLFKNLGGGQFDRVNSGSIAVSTLSGIGAAWGDFNNDGYLDLINVRPDWIQGAPGTGTPGAPHLMINDGPPDYTFTRLQGTAVDDAGADTYLHPTLSDFDEDGDLDIFIGMGSGMPKKDLIYRNLLQETGTLDFERLEGSLLSETLLEGNQWSFEDIDNDNDLDAYVTNWANVVNNQNVPRPNTLFRNDGTTYTEIDAGAITTDEDLSTTACWGDFDNDGDLDVVTSADSTYPLRFYQNNGQGQFTSIAAGDLGYIEDHHSGGSAGDFDNDGDLDLYIPGPAENCSFLRNDLSNNYNWVKFRMKGTNSNASGIGAKVFLYTIIEGEEVVQRREVSGASTFFGTNSLVQHFGLKTAIEIDSVVVQWPSGLSETFYGLGINTLHLLEEGQGGLTSTIIQYQETGIRVFPNPSNGKFTINTKRLNGSDSLRLFLLDAQGRQLMHLGNWSVRAAQEIELDISSQIPAGAYYLQFVFGDRVLSTEEIIIQ